MLRLRLLVVALLVLAAVPAGAAVTGSISYSSGAAQVTGTGGDLDFPTTSIGVRIYLGGSQVDDFIAPGGPSNGSMPWSWTLPGGASGPLYAQIYSRINGATYNTSTVTVGSSPPPPDNDGDGIPDATDPDDDNDGRPDNLDFAPFDPSVQDAPGGGGGSGGGGSGGGTVSLDYAALAGVVRSQVVTSVSSSGLVVVSLLGICCAVVLLMAWLRRSHG
jgi:hypothetical protein